MELHFRVGNAQLGESWIEESNGVEVGRCQGSLFSYGFTLFDAAPKVLLERKNKHTLFPKLIMQPGLPTFLPLMGLCMRPRGVELQACFAQGVCLWVTLNFHHNSKNCRYILPAW